MKLGINRITPRERVKTALRHKEPDRVPVDFLATPEIWNRLIKQLQPDISAVGSSEFFDPAWEAILRYFEVDCRVLSYDQFYQPPESVLHEGAKVNWWDALSRSTHNRMWRQGTPGEDYYDIWGHHLRIAQNPTGAYDEYASFPLKEAASIDELKSHPWPDPDWWDFSPLPGIIKQLDTFEEYHLRWRIGSVFEIAWQLRGMDTFLMDLATDPKIPFYIMDRLTEVYVESTRRVLDLAGDRLDMVYLYDDILPEDVRNPAEDIFFLIFSELGSLVKDGVIYLSLNALPVGGTPNDLYVQRYNKIILIASRDHGETWEFVNVLLDYEDVTSYGFPCNSQECTFFTGSSLAEKDGKVILLSSPFPLKLQGLIPHNGTYVFEFMDITTGEIKEDVNGKKIAKMYLPITEASGGLADYDESNQKGIIIGQTPHDREFQPGKKFWKLYSTNQLIIE